MLFLSLSSIGKVFFHLELFQYFLFIFGSCNLNMVYQRVDYWAFCWIFSELPGSVVWCFVINFGESSIIITSSISSFSLCYKRCMEHVP